MTLPSAPWVIDPDTVSHALVARALNKEKAAERALYERHAPRLRRFVIRAVGDTNDASDVVQETFARAFRLLPSLDDLARFVPWLFGIAKNVSRECVKSRRCRMSVDPVSLRMPSPVATTPEEEALGREAARIVAGVVARMSAGRREALVLRIDAGLSYEEIARRLGWSLSKAKVEVHRARREIEVAVGRQPKRSRRRHLLPAMTGVVLMLLLVLGLLGARPSIAPDSEPLSSNPAPTPAATDNACTMPIQPPDAGPPNVDPLPVAACTPSDIPWSIEP